MQLYGNLLKFGAILILLLILSSCDFLKPVEDPASEEEPPGSQSITAISAHSNYAIYLTSKGEVYCVYMSFTYGPALKKSKVRGLKDIVEISAGPANIMPTVYDCIALDKEGRIFVWDFDIIAERADSAVAFPFSSAFGSAKITHVATGGVNFPFYAATDSNGGLWTWGYNPDYALGDSSIVANRAQPAKIAGFNQPVKQLVGGTTQMLALTSSGHIYQWGTISAQDKEVYKKPSLLSAESGHSKIAAGGNCNLATRSDATVFSWGHLTDGLVPGIITPRSMSAGAETYFAPIFVMADGSVLKTWFSNITGMPQQVQPLDELAGYSCKLVAAANRAFFVTTDNRIVCLPSMQTNVLVLNDPF